jgi:O-antigen/teichoic acid export membrane protein
LGRIGRLIATVKHQIRSRPLARAVGVLAGGAALGQVVTVVSMPIITRVYSTADLGHLQYYALVMMAVVSVAALRYETAILLPEDPEDAAAVVVTALLATCVMIIVLTVAVWLLRDSTLLGGDRAALRPYVFLLPVSALGASVYQTLTLWCVRDHDYARIARTRIAQAFGQSGSQVALGAWGIGLPGLLVGDAIGRVTGSTELARAVWRRWGTLVRRLRWSRIAQAAYRYRHFPLVSSWSSLLNTAGLTLPPLVIGGLYGTQTLGLFGLADRALGFPTMMIGQAISQVYMGRAAQLGATDPRSLRALFVSSVRRLMILGAVPYLVVVVAGPPLFAFVFGAAWREAGVYGRILAAVQFVGFVSWPLLPTLNLLERQGWQLAWDSGRLALGAGAVALAHTLGWSARAAIAAYGTALIVSYAAHLIASYAAIVLRERRTTTVRPGAATAPSVGPAGG